MTGAPQHPQESHLTLVTVYMPTRNRVGMLARALASLQAQTHTALEIIVVDDGSNDDTGRYLSDAAAKDQRIKLITHPVSEGAPASRNQAIQLASGYFVTGLDDDDEFEPHRIETFLKTWDLMEKMGSPPSLLYSQDVHTIDGNAVYSTAKRGNVDHQSLLQDNYIGNQVFAPRSRFIEAGLFDEALPAWQDLDLFIRMVRKYGPGRLVDVATYRMDVAPRLDRISADERRIRDAYARLCRKHFSGEPRKAQTLMLQIFARHYGIRPKIADIFDFLRLGFWPKGFAWLLLASLRT